MHCLRPSRMQGHCTGRYHDRGDERHHLVDQGSRISGANPGSKDKRHGCRFCEKSDFGDHKGIWRDRLWFVLRFKSGKRPIITLEISAAANVAGITTAARVPTAQYPHEEYDKVLEINTKGVMVCMQEQIQVMQKQNATCTPGFDNPLRAQRGSIVNIASVTGFAALQNMMPYVVSKHAVVGLTKSAAVDHAREEIRINAVCPGMTETPMVAARQASVTPGKMGWAVEGNGRQRLAIPEEIADVCIFLSGCGASYMTGSAVTVDAGHLAALRYEGSLS